MRILLAVIAILFALPASAADLAVHHSRGLVTEWQVRQELGGGSNLAIDHGSSFKGTEAKALDAVRRCRSQTKKRCYVVHPNLP